MGGNYMLDSNKAFEILGVSRDASRNGIEKRYSIFIKKHRQSVSLGESSESEQEEFTMQTEAYNLLMGYTEPQTDDAETRKPNPIYKKMGLDEKKVGNFFYYYKFHIIIGIVVLLIVVFSVRSCVTMVRPDFSIGFIGDIMYSGNDDKLIELIKAKLPDIKEPGVDGAYISADGNAPADQASVMKAAALFSTDDIGIYILDSNNFKKFARNDAFISLDEIAAGLGTDSDKNRGCVVKSQYQKEEHLYGIIVSQSSALSKSNIQANEMIVAIPQNCKQKEKAIELIRYLMK
jgi:hypothetical protein